MQQAHDVCLSKTWGAHKEDTQLNMPPPTIRSSFALYTQRIATSDTGGGAWDVHGLKAPHGSSFWYPEGSAPAEGDQRMGFLGGASRAGAWPAPRAFPRLGM